MKKLLLLALPLLSIHLATNAQGVPNPSFEFWNSDTTTKLDTWYDSNLWAQSTVGQPNVTQSGDAQNGQFAVRLETIVQGPDSILAYVGSSPLGDSLESGGFPYTQQPDTLRGWAKYDLLGSDSALIAVVCKASGVILSTDIHYFTGSASNYTYFELPLSVSSAPDSVVIAAISCNPGTTQLTNGSWLMLDNLSFNTPAPIPNGDFEQWNTIVRMEPSGWSSPDSYGDPAEVATRTTDAITGQYAVRIETQSLFGGQDTIGYITSGVFNGPSQTGGMPYTMTTDTLCGFYKYNGVGNDSAIVGAVFYQNGTLISVAAMNLHDQGTYTYFEIPFQLGMTPDTVRIDLWSSHPSGLPMPGSVLIIDSLRFKSDPLVGITQAAPTNLKWLLYPNPSAGLVGFEAATDVEGTYSLEILSLSGQKVYASELSLQSGTNHVKIDLQNLSPGVYTARLSGNAYLGYMKVVVE